MAEAAVAVLRTGTTGAPIALRPLDRGLEVRVLDAGRQVPVDLAVARAVRDRFARGERAAGGVRDGDDYEGGTAAYCELSARPVR